MPEIPAAPEPPKRGRGRPATREEAARVRRVAARLTAARADAVTLARELDHVRETELAELLGVDRSTLRRWKAAG